MTSVQNFAKKSFKTTPTLSTIGNGLFHRNLKTLTSVNLHLVENKKYTLHYLIF